MASDPNADPRAGTAARLLGDLEDQTIEADRVVLADRAVGILEEDLVEIYPAERDEGEDMLEAVVGALARTGRLERTYILFTSDNGLLMGQHQGFAVKSSLYEETIRVPLYVRGPGLGAGTTEALAVNIDLAPTVAELAGVPIADSVDGRSLAPFLPGQPPASWRSDVYVEQYAGPDQTYALRSPRWFCGESEQVRIFDMLADPYQLTNLRVSTSPGDLDAFRKRVRAYAACRGAGCRI